MLQRGDRQHDIAAYFGVNGGRIAEIATETTFAHVKVHTNDLPPPGPYLTGKASLAVKKRLEDIRATLAAAMMRIDEELDKLK
ncbi:MAG: hypothetical protein QM759_11460 [Terricaulis sp.]